MRKFSVLSILIVIFSCIETEKKLPFTSIEIKPIYEDSLSIRAINIVGNTLQYAANKGTFGNIDLNTGKVMESIEKYHTSIPEFRAIAHTATDFFMLSVESPALLYKTGDNGKMDLVYKEEGEGVFYDAITFWNNKEGIAVGDTVNGCISIIITRDGGYTWNKLSCDVLPELIVGEGAFAASNTNIKTVGDKTWVATTKRILFSPDKGLSWEANSDHHIDTSEPTSGVYSIDFYDENIGIVFGGDYTNPIDPRNNKSITKNGGKSWRMIANGNKPGYRSCVQFVPNANGYGIVALGFKGIDYSNDMGESWTHLSDESFFTLRFLNDSIAYAAGKNRIAKLTFK